MHQELVESGPFFLEAPSSTNTRWFRTECGMLVKLGLHSAMLWRYRPASSAFARTRPRMARVQTASARRKPELLRCRRMQHQHSMCETLVWHKCFKRFPRPQMSAQGGSLGGVELGGVGGRHASDAGVGRGKASPPPPSAESLAASRLSASPKVSLLRRPDGRFGVVATPCADLQLSSSRLQTGVPVWPPPPAPSFDENRCDRQSAPREVRISYPWSRAAVGVGGWLGWEAFRAGVLSREQRRVQLAGFRDTKLLSCNRCCNSRRTRVWADTESSHARLDGADFRGN